eukprot:COSAG02_NODE_6221_length_3716_cov_1.907407_2_plen_128_part_00
MTAHSDVVFASPSAPFTALNVKAHSLTYMLDLRDEPSPSGRVQVDFKLLATAPVSADGSTDLTHAVDQMIRKRINPSISTPITAHPLYVFSTTTSSAEPDRCSAEPVLCSVACGCCCPWRSLGTPAR